MNNLTVKQVAEICGIQPKQIHVYIGRGKILQRQDKKIDISELINEEFILKHKKEVTKTVLEGNNPKSEKTYYSENELRRLKAEKLEEDIKLAKFRNEKIEGRLIPTDIIQRAIQEVIQRYKMTFVQQSEQLLRDTLNEMSASNEMITKVCSTNIQLSNEAFTRAIAETKLAIKNCISESLSLNS